MAVLMKSFTVKTFTLTIVCVILTFDFLFLNIMQWIFSWALRVHEKIVTLSDFIWAFSVGLWICVFPSEASFNEKKLVSGWLLKAFFSLDRPFENGARRNRKYDTFYNKKIP